jgi:hypothetical protein
MAWFQRTRGWIAASAAFLQRCLRSAWLRITRPVVSRYRDWRASAKHPRLHAFQQQSSPAYWKRRATWSHLWFGLTSRYYSLRRKAFDHRQTLSVTRSLLWTIIPQVIISVTVVTFLALVEHLILKPIGVIDWLLPTPSGAGVNASRLNASSYDSILSTLAQIAGVFIGLYFTAVNLVASTIYARVPGDIRLLVVSEKLGNVYVQIVAFLGATSTLVLAGNVIGLPLSVLNLALVTVTGLVSIFSFLVLGKRVFHFFNPTQLTWQLFTELLDCIKAATPDGFRWHDPAFQNHARRQAEKVLGTYRRIVDLTCCEDYRHIEAESLVAIANNTLLLLRHYGREKARIPTESLWFARAAEEHDWLVADPTRLDLALKSSTGIQPKMVPDMLWFEHLAASTVTAIFEELLARGELGSAVLIVTKAQNSFGNLAEDLAINEATSLFNGLREITRSHATAEPPDGSQGAMDPEKTRFELALCDAIGMGVINILLGLSRRLAVITPEAFAASVSSVRWDRSRTVYGTGMPREVVTQLEWLQKRLNFEFEAEGMFVTSQWYSTQIAHVGLVRIVSTSLLGLTDLLEATFVKDVDALIQMDRLPSAAALIQRGLEACHKFPHHFDEIKGCLERLSIHRRDQNIPCPEIVWEELLKRITAVRERILVLLGNLAPKLANMSANKSLPDFFGQACLTLTNESHTALVTGNEPLFQKLFPLSFQACLTAHDQLWSKMTDRSDRTRMIFATEPIVDLMSLSGFAIVYSELGGKQFRDVALRCWDDFFAKHKDAQALLKQLGAILHSRETSLMSGPRMLLRTEWQIRLKQQLAALGLTNRHVFHRLTGEEKPSHESAIVRALSDGHMMLEHGEDIFAAVYLATRSPASGFELTRRAKAFAWRLRRELGKSEGAAGEEGEIDG